MQNFLLAAPAGGDLFSTMIPLVMMVVVFYFILIRPQKKREKETQAMRSAIEVGDEIVTIGGIIGRVVSFKDETIVIESGSANTKLRITKSAVQANITAQENARERRQEQVALQEQAKEDKKREKEDSKRNKVDE